MKVKIADKEGIATPVRNQIVDVIMHPKFKSLYQFEFGKDIWICSDFAIGESLEGSTAII